MTAAELTNSSNDRGFPRDSLSSWPCRLPPMPRTALSPGRRPLLRQELFENEELTGYLKNMLNATKSVYEQVVYESDIDARFADQLEKNAAVKVYAKLPGWFAVPTPLGAYRPDWALLVDTDAGTRLYLVVETKGSLHADDLRLTEEAKIKCGRAHFKALELRDSPARYEVAMSVEDLLGGISAG